MNATSVYCRLLKVSSLKASQGATSLPQPVALSTLHCCALAPHCTHCSSELFSVPRWGQSLPCQAPSDLSPIVWQHSTFPQFQIHPDSTHICPSLGPHPLIALLPAMIPHGHFLMVPLDKAQHSQAPPDGPLLHSNSPLLTLCSGHLELIPGFTESLLSPSLWIFP